MVKFVLYVLYIGEFWQTPHSHFNGFGCAKCNNLKLDTELFIKKAKELHRR